MEVLQPTMYRGFIIRYQMHRKPQYHVDYFVSFGLSMFAIAKGSARNKKAAEAAGKRAVDDEERLQNQC